MKKEIMYDTNVGTFYMMFGMGRLSTNNRKVYPKKKRYYYEDKRTKKYGNQRLELLKNE